MMPQDSQLPGDSVLQSAPGEPALGQPQLEPSGASSDYGPVPSIEPEGQWAPLSPQNIDPPVPSNGVPQIELPQARSRAAGKPMAIRPPQNGTLSGRPGRFQSRRLPVASSSSNGVRSVGFTEPADKTGQKRKRSAQAIYRFDQVPEQD